RLAAGRVRVRQHLRGDLDEERVEIALVPRAEDLAHFGRFRAEPGAQQVIGLGDELHVGVLDAVVHHLYEVAGAVRPDVRAARCAVDLRGDLLEYRPQPP